MHPMRFVTLTAATAAGTIMVGWWAVPVVAALWCVVTRGARQHHASVALSAALSWGILLGVKTIQIGRAHV